MKNRINSKTYGCKLILYGEYGVIGGGEILATPVHLYTGTWRMNGKKEQCSSMIGMQNYLLKLLGNGVNLGIDFEKIKTAIDQGIYFDSAIPMGYGLGSSGAYTAAIYDCFVEIEDQSSNISELQEQLAYIESHFHGVSSGIDPLVVLLNKSVHITNKKINTLCLPTECLNNYFLIDTGISRDTAPLVEKYLERLKDDNYAARQAEYHSLVSNAITAQLINEEKQISKLIDDISRWQYRFLDFAIPENLKNLWEYSLDHSDFSIKLCGAGGGGFLLGYSNDVATAIEQLKGYNVDVIHLQ